MSTRKVFLAVALGLALLVVIYALGPVPATPVYTAVLPQLPSDGKELDNHVKTKEAAFPVKPDNQARIVWADSTKKEQTEYAVVYLHGFTASQGDGDPVHRNFAKKFGCNLYLARLATEGLKDKEAMLDFTPEKIWASALEAYAIGRKLGKKVILMGSSNGALLCLRLAATFPEAHALILYSPNIKIKQTASVLLNKPWGLQIARLVLGGNDVIINHHDPKVSKYWYSRHRVEALPQLQEFVSTTSTNEIFARIKQPVLLLYYYKNKEQQDHIVSVDAMLKMYEKLGTPGTLKRKVALPKTGHHIMASPLFSKDIPGVAYQTEHFARETLKMLPVPAAIQRAAEQ